jgi:glycosyltransferase involved in cell wall biosynthesis
MNKMKLLVFPSYSEGLPSTLLEGMACGTPVLVTPVGAMPDIIQDGKNGFIMQNNSPECIAKNIRRALDHPDLEVISKNARTLIEKNFSYKATVEKHKNLIEILQGQSNE